MFQKYTVSVLFFLYLLTPLSALTDVGVDVIVEDSPDTQSVAVEEEDTDSTPEVETESTIDAVIEESDEIWRSWKVSGDFRPIFTSLNEDGRNIFQNSEDYLGFRARIAVIKTLSTKFQIGAGLAGRCFIGDCDLEFILQPDIPGPNGLRGGQITFDELYLHWFRKGVRRFDVIAGRLQTRFVLRGGVYAKSLDRNDSNNTRITWTDGLHGTFRSENNWRYNFIVQRNDDEGTGSIRHGSLDFTESTAKNTYFLALENVRAWGPVVQRGFDLSYLPRSLLKDNDPDGRRVDYWGLVGRLAVRWPQRSEGFRFRGGVEIGYAPETPTNTAAGFDASGDGGGLAWNVVVSGIDIWPGHSLGVNYGRTDTGWLLSPQYLPNSELIELRYQWQSERWPLLEARIRWQEDMDKPVAVQQKLSEFDFYLRLTWEFEGSPTWGW